ncbi:UNVERIFIED_CONTAM: BURP domain-containing protein 16 [Sesamum radiatum]|uniref:BURP domain-containing protein 16 n=1 Tax=Sesamum radiatum TaxID=300843 RepID=A0AAW2S7L3_SESRA
MAHSMSTFLLFPFLFYLSFMSSAAPADSHIPYSSASTQIKFWSPNVLNKMPESISSKLSPLTNQDSDYYAEKIMEDSFSADTEFCSRSRLACSSGADAYVTALVYNKYGGAIPPLEKVDQFSFFRLSTLKEGNVIRLSNLKDKLLALASKSTQGSGSELKIKRIKQYNVQKIVACHEMYLPFATYFCHSLPSTQIYAVEVVEPSTGAPVNTVVAVCHMDTSAWPEEHVAFKIVKLGPGQGEVCHWLSEIDVAWIAGGE